MFRVFLNRPASFSHVYYKNAKKYSILRKTRSAALFFRVHFVHTLYYVNLFRCMRHSLPYTSLRRCIRADVCESMGYALMSALKSISSTNLSKSLTLSFAGIPFSAKLSSIFSCTFRSHGKKLRTSNDCPHNQKAPRRSNKNAGDPVREDPETNRRRFY